MVGEVRMGSSKEPTESELNLVLKVAIKKDFINQLYKESMTHLNQRTC